MESKRVSFAVLLLLIGAVVMVAAQDNQDNGPACLQICYTDAAYMTCPSTGYEKLKPACNCCIGGPGCSLYRENGEQIC